MLINSTDSLFGVSGLVSDPVHNKTNFYFLSDSGPTNSPQEFQKILSGLYLRVGWDTPTCVYENGVSNPIAHWDPGSQLRIWIRIWVIKMWMKLFLKRLPTNHLQPLWWISQNRNDNKYDKVTRQSWKKFRLRLWTWCQALL